MRGREFGTGYHRLEFNAAELPSGVYFTRLRTQRTGSFGVKSSEARKMVLLRWRRMTNVP
ncbi:MAG: hypothetical protein WB626_11830 [Bacteroidota bacterium]